MNNIHTHDTTESQISAICVHFTDAMSSYAELEPSTLNQRVLGSSPSASTTFSSSYIERLWVIRRFGTILALA